MHLRKADTCRLLFRYNNGPMLVRRPVARPIVIFSCAPPTPILARHFARAWLQLHLVLRWRRIQVDRARFLFQVRGSFSRYAKREFPNNPGPYCTLRIRGTTLGNPASLCTDGPWDSRSGASAAYVAATTRSELRVSNGGRGAAAQRPSAQSMVATGPRPGKTRPKVPWDAGGNGWSLRCNIRWGFATQMWWNICGYALGATVPCLETMHRDKTPAHWPSRMIGGGVVEG